MTQLAEVLIEEHEDGNRLVLALIEPPLHQVEVLVAVEHAYVEARHLFRETAKDGQVGDDVAAPILREHEDANALGQRLKGPYRLGVEGDPRLVLAEAILVERHRGLE